MYTLWTAELPLEEVRALAPPEFGSSVNPKYSNQRGQIMPTTLLLAPPDLKT